MRLLNAFFFFNYFFFYFCCRRKPKERLRCKATRALIGFQAKPVYFYRPMTCDSAESDESMLDFLDHMMRKPWLTRLPLLDFVVQFASVHIAPSLFVCADERIQCPRRARAIWSKRYRENSGSNNARSNNKLFLF